MVIMTGIAWKATLNVSTPAVGAVLGVLLLQSWWNDPLVYFVGVFAAWSLSVEALLYVVFRPLVKRLRTLDDCFSASETEENPAKAYPGGGDERRFTRLLTCSATASSAVQACPR